MKPKPKPCRICGHPLIGVKALGKRCQDSRACYSRRLEYLRSELRAERISYGELAELQSLIPHINPDDTELLEAAGVQETKVIK
jgi:hypothetical protein